MAGISSKSSGKVENRYKFNEATERTTDLDLQWDETDCRTYDPQIGRFLQVDPFSEISDHLSPFVYGNNNPILRNDPYGLKDSTVNGEAVNTAPTLDEVVVYGKKTKPPQAQETSSNNSRVVPLPIGPLPSVSPINPPPEVIPFNRPAINPGTASGIGLLSRLLGVFVASIWPSPVGLGSDRPNPAFTPASGFIPYPGHGNNHENSNPHIVYEFTFTPQDSRTPVLKYGISDEYRNGLNRPERQKATLQAIFGNTVSYRILTRTINRQEALILERRLVNAHFNKWDEMPRAQSRPGPF